MLSYILLHYFNNLLVSDSSTNRMQESLKLFKFVCQCRWLKGVAVVIFLNKTDLLRDKLRKKTSDIKDYFPQFKGDSYEFDQVVQFIWVIVTFRFYFPLFTRIFLGSICPSCGNSRIFYAFDVCDGN